MKRLIKSLLVRLAVLLYAVRGRVAHETLPQFGNRPKNLKIDLPRNISGSDRIFFGEDVEFGPGCFIIAVTKYPSRKMQSSEFPVDTQEFDPTIRIGNRVTATANVQIFAQSSVVVGDDVMFASNVFVNDGSHGFQTGGIPYKYQPIFKIAPIVIERGSWIGQNVVIMPGVTIGEYSVIGANSVVTRSVPPQSIAVGSPAKVIKRWNDSAGQWVSSEQLPADSMASDTVRP